MAKLTTLDYYSKACLERAGDALNKFYDNKFNLTSLERHVGMVVKYCSDNGYCTFDDIPKEEPVEEPVEAPKKKAKKKAKSEVQEPDVVDEDVNTPEAQEQTGQNVFKEASKDNPNG